MKLSKTKLKQIIKEEMQNLKNESYEGIDPDDMTHGEYFVHSGGPAGMEAELDEFSVAIRAARDAGVSPKDILAFVQQVLGDAQSDQVIDVTEGVEKAWCVGFEKDGETEHETVYADAGGIAERKIKKKHNISDKAIKSTKEGKCSR